MRQITTHTRAAYSHNPDSPRRTPAVVNISYRSPTHYFWRRKHTHAIHYHKMSQWRRMLTLPTLLPRVSRLGVAAERVYRPVEGLR